MLDHLIYHTTARVVAPGPGRYPVMIAGRSCLAGDVFGRYRLKTRLKPGAHVRFGDAAGYTMVKKNWFNGLPMPAICVKRLDGTLETVTAEYGTCGAMQNTIAGWGACRVWAWRMTATVDGFKHVVFGASRDKAYAALCAAVKRQHDEPCPF